MNLYAVLPWLLALLCPVSMRGRWQGRGSSCHTARGAENAGESSMEEIRRPRPRVEEMALPRAALATGWESTS